MKKWPLHPKPYEYQILYRWIEQLADIYEVSYKSFCKNVLTLTAEETNNLRTILPERALTILSNGTGVTVDDLRGRDLNGIFKKLYIELEEMFKKDPKQFSCFLNRISPQKVKNHLGTELF